MKLVPDFDHDGWRLPTAQFDFHEMTNPEVDGHDMNGVPIKCGVRIFYPYATQEKPVVILTDLGIGCSVTNSIESLAARVFAKHLQGRWQPEDVTWIEHYPNREDQQEWLSGGFKETWDLVTLKQAGSRFYGPEWKRISMNDFLDLMDIPPVLRCIGRPEEVGDIQGDIFVFRHLRCAAALGRDGSMLKTRLEATTNLPELNFGKVQWEKVVNPPAVFVKEFNRVFETDFKVNVAPSPAP